MATHSTGPHAAPLKWTDVADRPDAPSLDGRCEVALCDEEMSVCCWSTEHREYFRYCEGHAEEMCERFGDLEVVE